MEPPKISFGFSKLSKKTNIIPSKVPLQEKQKVELIECLEGQSIKVKDAIEEVKKPLVIPLKDNQKNLLDRIREFKKREQQPTEDTRPDSELTPDELVARQLLKEAQQRLANGSTSDKTKVSVLPINKDTPTLEGEKEPSLEDYESVPISDYGLALLRGMGWKEGMAIGKNVSQSAIVSVPELRPKGLGLGATKVVQAEMPAKKATDKDGNELILKKGAFARVIAGNQKGNYCEVQGFDEDAGRVIMKVYPKGEIVNINELMLVPVTKEEFSKGYKIINNAKYEEYKEKSDKRLDDYRVKAESSHRHVKKEEPNWRSDSDESDRKDSKSLKKERPSTSSSKYRERSESPKKHSRSKDRRKHKKDRRPRSRSKERSSCGKSKKKSRRRSSSSNSDSSGEERRYRRRSKHN